MPRLPLRAACALAALLAAASAAHAAEPSPAPAPRRKPVSVAVLDLAALGADEKLAQNLTAIVAAEVARYDDVKPITRREVAALLDVERQRQLVGCTDDNCLSAVVGALGVSKIVSGQFGRVESSYVLTLHLIDTRTAKVEARVVRTVPVENQGLVAAVKGAVTELIGDQTSSRNQPPRIAVKPKLVAHEEDRVVLDASRCYDPDGDPLRFRWRQVDGPPAQLESPEAAQAAFHASEVGTYTFAVEITDGRSPAKEEPSQVEVRRRRRFGLGGAFQTLLPFNRMVVAHGDSSLLYRNRSQMGGALLADLSFTERWVLTAEVGASWMNIFPENEAEKGTEYVDVLTAHVLVGVRSVFAFDGFKLFVGLSLGTARRFLTVGYGDLKLSGVQSEAVMGDLSVGVDIPLPTLGGVPLGEYVGLFAQGGVRLLKGTDKVVFTDIPIDVPGNGFLWGVNGTLGLYVRL